MSFLQSNFTKKNIQKTFRSPLIRNMLTVAIITFGLKIIAFYKETVVAGTFGLSEILDTFLVAILVPTFVQSVFLSSLKNLFIPNYIIELKNNGDKSSFQSLVFLLTFLISLLSILLTYYFIDIFLEVVFPNHTEQYYNLVKTQLLIILPCLILWGFSSVITGILEIEDKFLFTTLHDLFPLLTVILSLLYFKEYFGPAVLAYATLIGSVLSFIYLLFVSNYYGYLSMSKPHINENSREMIRQLPPKISSSFLSAMNSFIDQFFAGQLVVGSIAAINYGNRFPAFGVTIVILALGNVLLPHFSRLVNENLKDAYHHLFKTMKIVFISGICVVVIMILCSDWIIELWLERDEFTHEDTLKVSAIQQILLVHVPFYLCTRIMVKFLTSINKNKFMAWISLVNLLLNIILNLALIKIYGVYGLALSTTFVLIISSCFYFTYTYKQYKKILS